MSAKMHSFLMNLNFLKFDCEICLTTRFNQSNIKWKILSQIFKKIVRIVGDKMDHREISVSNCEKSICDAKNLLQKFFNIDFSLVILHKKLSETFCDVFHYFSIQHSVHVRMAPKNLKLYWKSTILMHLHEIHT